MICCRECFNDPEIRAGIEILEHKGNCPICKKQDVWIYDSDIDAENSAIEELITSILEIYIPESELPDTYPEGEKELISKKMISDWNIFSCSEIGIKSIIEGIVENSLQSNEKILLEKVGIPKLFDEEYLQNHSIMGCYSWEEFKKCLRNKNRFHNNYINLEILASILKDTEVTIPKGEKFFRARISNEKGKKGFKRTEMWAPPDDIATPGRANSKGQSCLYLSSKKKTTVKEIRAHAFDYVTIATFKLIKDIKILDFSSITHNSPFYSNNDKVDYLINERLLKAMEDDLAKPMSRWDSDLDYLPTQYISDFAKYLGYDGVRYISTFDKESYNLALFNSRACTCIYHRNFSIGELEYKMNAL